MRVAGDGSALVELVAELERADQKTAGRAHVERRVAIQRAIVDLVQPMNAAWPGERVPCGLDVLVDMREASVRGCLRGLAIGGVLLELEDKSRLSAALVIRPLGTWQQMLDATRVRVEGTVTGIEGPLLRVALGTGGTARDGWTHRLIADALRTRPSNRSSRTTTGMDTGNSSHP